MVRFMDAHPRCGLSSCGVYHPDGAFAYPARRWQTLRVVLARRCGLERWWPGVVDDYLYGAEAPTSTFVCDWVSGCFMLVRREAIRKVGPFDTRFGKYFEDVDICRRMQRAGWAVMYHGATRCTHFEQRASRRLLSDAAADRCPVAARSSAPTARQVRTACTSHFAHGKSWAPGAEYPTPLPTTSPFPVRCFVST
jgi:GT2 family glycosyltransferase